MRETLSKRITLRTHQRHLAMKATRNFFDRQGFIEVDAPALILANCVEAHIDPIEVSVDLGSGHGKQKRYLQTSPEIYHKRLLSHGLPQIYQLSHVFRNGEYGQRHLPEFSLLEWYRAGATLEDLISDCEQLFVEISDAISGSAVNFLKPFERITLETLWKEKAGIDLRQALVQMDQGDHLALVRSVQAAGLYLRDGANFEDAFHHVMLTQIEPNIGQERPCVVMQWPRQLAALARINERDHLFADRFEIYFQGLEIANAFDELIDPNEQKKRFENEAQSRCREGKPGLPMNQIFLSDLSCLPPSAGIAVGFDRLLMLILGSKEIENVLSLPWLEGN